MKIYEFGEKDKPVILLLPGTCCYWKSNFAEVSEGLQDKFRVAIVSYSGFDETEQTEFVSMLDETEKIEDYIKKNYNGTIHAAYGCSLGGSFVGLMISRKNIHINHGIIGSSDMDQAGKIAAKLQCGLLLPIMAPYIKSGRFKSNFMNRIMEKMCKENGAYIEKFMDMFGSGKYDLSFYTTASMKNQFYSDLITPLPEKIQVDGTTIHVFYAKKMGKKYRKRYEKYFKEPDIIEQDLQHEELLACYPDQWAELVKKVCGMR